MKAKELRDKLDHLIAVANGLGNADPDVGLNIYDPDSDAWFERNVDDATLWEGGVWIHTEES